MKNMNIDYNLVYKIVAVVCFLLVLFLSSGPLLDKGLSWNKRIIGFFLNFGIYFIVYAILMLLFKGRIQK